MIWACPRPGSDQSTATGYGRNCCMRLYAAASAVRGCVMCTALTGRDAGDNDRIHPGDIGESTTAPHRVDAPAQFREGTVPDGAPRGKAAERVANRPNGGERVDDPGAGIPVPRLPAPQCRAPSPASPQEAARASGSRDRPLPAASWAAMTAACGAAADVPGKISNSVVAVDNPRRQQSRPASGKRGRGRLPVSSTNVTPLLRRAGPARRGRPPGTTRRDRARASGRRPHPWR